MDDQKEYWIKLFFKKCTSLQKIQEQIDGYIEWCDSSYSVTESYLEDLKNKYTIDDYINRLVPVIDKHLTIDDLKELVKFYSTETGKKLTHYKFLEDIGKVGSEINMDIEKDFAMGHKRKDENRESLKS